ncbi:DNA methyltransferase [Pseudoalteromonas maricaloris]|uniref:DNA adenine methylase n=1 Tax=Pseudoalteromonas maricaloris TaxID=184924 RepID=UPI0021ADF890|nr:DNA adenine methylase [Pseudoalteromonas flavipulchra]USE70856.1 DNA methyltransferase [Pseudoalteromonas flavipulchra]
MPVTPSPLRYPGGKTAITPMVTELINTNNLRTAHYVEPYAGGAGLALSLLFNGSVPHIHLNDIDISIWSFWHSILYRTDEFIELIEKTDITLDEWHKQKAIQESKSIVDSLTLGFSSFFLNRTNRSGIIQKAGVIGGLEQKSSYKLDCRFNKSDLILKIRKIASFSNQIHIYNMDAIDFIKHIETHIERSFYCIDPPYFVKGQSLYTNFYEPNDHERLASAISEIKGKWVMTYDYAETIKNLYSKYRLFTFSLNYSAADKKKGTELLIASTTLRVPQKLSLKKVSKKRANCIATL